MKSINEVRTFVDSINVDASRISLGINKSGYYLSLFEQNGQFVLSIPEGRGTHVAKFDSEESAVAGLMQNIWFFLKFEDRQHANSMLQLLRNRGYMKL